MPPQFCANKRKGKLYQTPLIVQLQNFFPNMVGSNTRLVFRLFHVRVVVHQILRDPEILPRHTVSFHASLQVIRLVHIRLTFYCLSSSGSTSPPVETVTPSIQSSTVCPSWGSVPVNRRIYACSSFTRPLRILPSKRIMLDFIASTSSSVSRHCCSTSKMLWPCFSAGLLSADVSEL